MIHIQLDFDRQELARYLDEHLNGPLGLRPSQRVVYDYVIGKVTSGSGGAIFIDARGGTGKPYIENTILAAVRLMDEESITLAVAASGIASILLLLGRTFILALKHRLSQQLIAHSILSDKVQPEN